MSGNVRTVGRVLAAGLILAASASCAGYDPLIDVLGGGLGLGRQATGEVRSIDTRRREIRVETGWRRSERIRYDGRTTVEYGRGRYPVGSLGRGDVVRVLLDEGHGRELYARRIQLLERANAGRGPGGDVVRVERLEGSVARIDHQRGTFDLRRSRGGNMRVILPANPSRDLADRFRRIRRGQNVRVEGYILDASRMELRWIF